MATLKVTQCDRCDATIGEPPGSGAAVLPVESLIQALGTSPFAHPQLDLCHVCVEDAAAFLTTKIARTPPTDSSKV